jgi:hypothetical protein
MRLGHTQSELYFNQKTLHYLIFVTWACSPEQLRDQVHGIIGMSTSKAELRKNEKLRRRKFLKLDNRKKLVGEVVLTSA